MIQLLPPPDAEPTRRRADSCGSRSGEARDDDDDDDTRRRGGYATIVRVGSFVVSFRFVSSVVDDDGEIHRSIEFESSRVDTLIEQVSIRRSIHRSIDRSVVVRVCVRVRVDVDVDAR